MQVVFVYITVYTKNRTFYFMLTERFLQFVKAEFNDFWQKSAQKPANEQEQSMFEQMYAYFMGKEQKNTSQQERAQAYKYYKNFRQNNTITSNAISEEERKHYNALEIAVGSSWAEIKLAYKTAMKKYHPDRFAQDVEKQQIAQILAQKINEAYRYFEKKLAENG